MKQYIGTKTILAEAMTSFEYYAYRDAPLLITEDGESEIGYLVETIGDCRYNHGEHTYKIHWESAEDFEESYQPTDQGMSFAHSLQLLESGYIVTRLDNNFGIKIQLTENAYDVPTLNIANNIGSGFVAWLPLNVDIMANDWVVVES